MNLDPLVPEARPIVEKAASVYIRHTQQDFVGLRMPQPADYATVQQPTASSQQPTTNH